MSEEPQDEVTERTERELHAKVEILAKWKEMMASKAFKEFMEVAQAQVDSRIDEVLFHPLENMLEAGKQEYMKGEISGIKLFMRIPATVVESIEVDVITLRKELSNEDE